jgi:hypothetical protein
MTEPVDRNVLDGKVQSDSDSASEIASLRRQVGSYRLQTGRGPGCAYRTPDKGESVERR